MRNSQHKTGGSTLPAALIITLVLCVLIGASFEFTNGIGRNTQGNGAVDAGIAMADGALEYLYANWRQAAKASPNLAPTTSEFNNIGAPKSTYFPDMQNCTLSNVTLTAVDPLLQPLASTTTVPPKQTGRGPGTYNYTYLATADVSVPTVSRTVTQKVRRVFQKRISSPWNFTVFYQDPLEIQPSSPLTLTGWVHTNDNLYTGSNQLTVTDRLTTAGTWNVGFAPGDGAHAGPPTAPNYPANEPPAQEDVFQAFNIDPRSFSASDPNPNNNSLREIAEVPVSGYADPVASQRYYNQAGIKVLIDATGAKKIYNQAGTLCTSASSGNDLKIYQAANGGIKAAQNVQDNREGAVMSLWNVDMNSFTGSAAVWNNILYISDQSATPANHKGIRISNAASLPTSGLTFATDNPLYIKGDWNTGGSPLSNSGTPTSPMNSSYAWRPSAIIADSITLLSNAWADGNANKSLSGRIASNTTINAALVAGNVPTGSSGTNYSGGAENFVRFIEDWTGKTFTYYGSMNELYASQDATGTWGKANVYAPGVLQWYFDDKFTLTAPPGTQITVSYVQQRWFQE